MASLDTVLVHKARQVRSYVETIGRQKTELFRDFPAGACGNISGILGALLKEDIVGEIEYVWGDRDGKSHGWLEIDGIVVDITSDQFSDGLNPVYVGPVTAFHESFSDIHRSSPGVSAGLSDFFLVMREALEE